MADPMLGKTRGLFSSFIIHYPASFSIVFLLFLIELQIETPPQSTYVQLDTGSGDLIVETPSSHICRANSPNPCTNFGSYVANASSTYQYIDSNFQVEYGGGDRATGDWVSDTYSIGGATLQNAQFGIMYQTTVLESIVGVSYPIIEGRNVFSGEPQYPNLPMLLVQQASTLLFGGIDTGKFSGELVTIDLIASGFDGFSGVVDFTVLLEGITGTIGGNQVRLPQKDAEFMNVLMDSGTTITQLPAVTVQQIWGLVGATPDSNDPNAAYIPCDQSEIDTLNFEFNGITIAVPMTQLAIFPGGTGTCQFCISIGTENIIGDTVLTAMYAIVAGPGGVPDTSSSSSSSSQSSTSSSTSSTASTTSSSSSSSSSSPTPTTKPMKCNMVHPNPSPTHPSFLTPLTQSPGQLFPRPRKTHLIPLLRLLHCKPAHRNPNRRRLWLQIPPLRISSACSCYNTASISLPTSSSSSSTSSTLSTSTTSSTPPAVTNNGAYDKNNCFRAVQGGGPAATAFCSHLFGPGILPTPTGINKACSALPSKVSSACSCAVPSSGGGGGVQKKVVKII
ncbi:acid protease [Hyaloscypha hepaticicola]|uniref:Acid protease n=1 Tax=Hyaloscypha hepaticicola TaxID=2082293 RepID=A0A2J6PH88_9HELO|nr:acid protease [Hyaloscypha hepaticicola]